MAARNEWSHIKSESAKYLWFLGLQVLEPRISLLLWTVSATHSRRVVSAAPGHLRLVTLTTVALSSFRIHKASLPLMYPFRPAWPCLLGDMLSILRTVTLVWYRQPDVYRAALETNPSVRKDPSFLMSYCGLWTGPLTYSHLTSLFRWRK